MIEGIGALLLSFVFVPDYGLGKGIYFGIWHSISSFCNGGFDLIGGFQSFTGYANNFLLNFTVCALIVVGGLGFAVTSEIVSYRTTRRLSMHSKIVLSITAILVVGGAVLFIFLSMRTLKPWGICHGMGKFTLPFISL